jgi:hypothetical protein
MEEIPMLSERGQKADVWDDHLQRMTDVLTVSVHFQSCIGSPSYHLRQARASALSSASARGGHDFEAAQFAMSDGPYICKFIVIETGVDCVSGPVAWFWM